MRCGVVANFLQEKAIYFDFKIMLCKPFGVVYGYIISNISFSSGFILLKSLFQVDDCKIPFYVSPECTTLPYK
jgi:hypothetical protein